MSGRLCNLQVFLRYIGAYAGFVQLASATTISHPRLSSAYGLKVICFGNSRSRTGSFRQELIQLGYPSVYHGYETLENRWQKGAHCKLVCKRYGNTSTTGDNDLMLEDFEEVFPGYDALTDMPIPLFASELVVAHPDAKVILNRRLDVDAWYASILGTFIAWENSWMHWVCSWFSPDLYWTPSGSNFFLRDLPCILWRRFRANGKWVYREYCSFLEWALEDGWEPLCGFLSNEVPDTEFPKGNASIDFQRRLQKAHASHRRDANKIWRR
ncbi:hypothetical protein P154DRAFT_541477 [Amniculicola lignicola CBS 123094]|uniref:Uncharacterized protein n=1 Tax=Amniculicola lignicola CBS 123094 TaxID=1392246 RepID=A0A6A5X188_9PLEO|nr:hypothetical protein P154DRAFT_541477 [Amniculicola lignicola CBS 123094]